MTQLTRNIYNMKNNTLLKGTLLSTAMMASAALIAQPLVQQINDGWKFKQARLSNWYPATVPGVIHTDLMDNDLLDDPFYRLNERGAQWVDKEDWIYETTFQLTPEMLNQQHLLIDCKGLDTYADVYLNDSLIIQADNMFREWQASIKKLATEGQNTLRVYFHSPIKHDLGKFDALNYQYFASNDQSENGGIFDKRVSVFARKAGYHYGWDWGPRLVTSGIWRPISVVGWSDAYVDDIYYKQPDVTASRAKLDAQIQIQADHAIPDAMLTITDITTHKVLVKKHIDIASGHQVLSLPFTIHHPKLWWTNGLGQAHRYNFQVQLAVGDDILDVKQNKIGVRSLKVVSEKDKDGTSFYFELNGHPVFAKGANYIPQDNFLTRVTPADYKKTIMSAVEANMNMLRIWGGGIYENDLFYDLCDEHGILVWQDFMFACSMYPAEGALLENIRQEAIDNVVRLRNHPSIAIWCGNNECQDAWYNWGWQSKYKAQSQAIADTVWTQFCNQYYDVLPDVVATYAPETKYWPSSPFAGKGHGSNDHDGDRHYWEVWHGEKPISQYNVERARFFSEYGFQSFPEFVSIKKYAPEAKDWDIRSEVMMAHQRGGEHANGLIETYMLNEYRRPADFKRFLYVNHVLQGDAIKTAIESHRRDMPYCMGTLFWQINDCWPVASWASRDYYGRWKAQHYFTRKAYDDVMVSPYAEDGQLNIYVVSDRLKRFRGKLDVKIMTFAGEVVAEETKRVQVQANGSHVLASYNVEELLKGKAVADVFVYAKLIDNKDQVFDNTYVMLKQKDMHYPAVDVSYTIEEVADAAQVTASMAPTAHIYDITLTAPQFARAVHLMVNDVKSYFADNYFDMLPGQTRTIRLSTDLSLKEVKESMTIESLGI